MRQTEKTIWNFRVRPVDVPLIARLNRAAEFADMPASQIVRQAIREKLERLAIEFPQINEIPLTPQPTESEVN